MHFYLRLIKPYPILQKVPEEMNLNCLERRSRFKDVFGKVKELILKAEQYTEEAKQTALRLETEISKLSQEQHHMDTVELSDIEHAESNNWSTKKTADQVEAMGLENGTSEMVTPSLPSN